MLRDPQNFPSEPQPDDGQLGLGSVFVSCDMLPSHLCTLCFLVASTWPKLAKELPDPYA